MNKVAVVIVFVALAGSAACGDDSSSMGTGISAPSGLSVTALDGGAHLTWMDNSDNEAQFLVQRKTGTEDWATVGMVPFNITQYHDANVTPGTTYMYRVMAMTQAGGSTSEGEYSNEVTFMAPSDGSSGAGGSSGTGGAGGAGEAGAAGAAHMAGGAGGGH